MDHGDLEKTGPMTELLSTVAGPGLTCEQLPTTATTGTNSFYDYPRAIAT